MGARYERARADPAESRQTLRGTLAAGGDGGAGWTRKARCGRLADCELPCKGGSRFRNLAKQMMWVCNGADIKIGAAYRRIIVPSTCTSS